MYRELFIVARGRVPVSKVTSRNAFQERKRKKEREGQGGKRERTGGREISLEWAI